MGETKLAAALKPFCEKLRSVVENGSDISVITHLDADGITSGSIIATALIRAGAKCSVRTVSDMNPSVIERMKADDRDFYVITDLGGGMAANFSKALKDRWVVIDHHQIPEQEMLTDDAGQVMNAWKYGIDGGVEVPAGGMAYMVASALDRKNRDLSCMAVVSAVGDRQDQGDKKSFIGLNKEILETAKGLGLVNVDLDIMLTGRETRPLHEALAFTSFPYIDGLTWNRDNCHSLLKNAGIKMKENGRWRVPAEFSQEEKSAILDAVAKFVVTSSKTSAAVIDDLVGYVYTLAGEDKRSQLRDAREFSTLLNACGRIGRSGVGIAICMGDRDAMLTAGEEISAQYRTTLRSYISTIFSEKWRVTDDGKMAFVNGDGLVAEDMLGAVSSLLSGSPTLAGRLVFVRALSQDGTYKFSSRKALGCTSSANLGLIMRHCAEAAKGTGGGHSAAAGCRIPSPALDDFITCVRSSANDPKFSAS
ncbi:DHH family phosphoesterase [Candidatus Nitrososphaera sp. FF02]|uniref:DHH family phosphoesterase n=1 Tax=Candidatus Nitrososphaera sp. FF02 TaxID=3398226 RepID=UPI0039ECDF6E